MPIHYLTADIPFWSAKDLESPVLPWGVHPSQLHQWFQDTTWPSDLWRCPCGAGVRDQV
jgi:hypothetical protein